MLTIFVVSDATGETAERMIRSALVQFKGAPTNVIRRGHTRTPKQVRTVVQEAAQQESLIVHTLVSNDLRRLMLAESRSHSVDSMDLMGPVLDRLATLLSRHDPRPVAGIAPGTRRFLQHSGRALRLTWTHSARDSSLPTTLP